MWGKIEQKRGVKGVEEGYVWGGREFPVLKTMIRVDIFEKCGAGLLLGCLALP